MSYYPHLISLSLLASLLAGCTAALSVDAPTLTIKDASDAPFWMTVRLTNNDDADLSVSHRGFRLVDSTGTSHDVDGMMLAQDGSFAFPSLAKIGSGESAEGDLAFNPLEERPPYTLKYDYAGATVEAVVSAG